MNFNVASPLPRSAVRPVGASGVVEGVAVTVAEVIDTPLALTARSATVYCVPLVNPGTVTGEAASAGSSAVHFPPSTEYW